jgi:transcription elongation factor Elf1
LGIALSDIHGVIRNETINTLAHVGMEYRWSKFQPSRNAELLEAERANDEVRDILTRMIGSEIRYTQLGYWLRGSPYGMVSSKIESQHGKRTILKPHETQAPIIRRMYELRGEGILSDDSIAQEMNRMGFRTPIKVIRDKHDRSQVISRSGGKLMTPKLLRVYVAKTIYAGVNTEKWTANKPVKCKFEGLVSTELWNRANRGKVTIRFDKDNPVQPIVEHKLKDERFAKKNVYNADFPYRKVVHCPTCNHALLGSASRGRLGKYYPAYHCTVRGHHFRVSKPAFDAVIDNFAEHVQVNPERVDQVLEAVMMVWNKRQGQREEQKATSVNRRQQLEAEMRDIYDRLKIVSSETMIKLMEEDIMKLEAQVKDLSQESESEIEQIEAQIPDNLTYVKYFKEHLKELLIEHFNPVMRAHYFGVIFDEVPAFSEIKDGTANISKIPGVNEIFKVAHDESVSLVRERGLEPPHLSAHAPKACVSTIPPLARPDYSNLRTEKILALNKDHGCLL